MASAKKPRDEAPQAPAPEKLSEADGATKVDPPLAPVAPSVEETVMAAFQKKAPGTITHPETLRPLAKAESPPPPPPIEDKGPKVRRYRVWAHGALHRNGVIHKPGDELDLLETEAATIVCLELVT